MPSNFSARGARARGVRFFSKWNGLLVRPHRARMTDSLLEVLIFSQVQQLSYLR